MSKKKQKRRFVPRMVLTAACATTVVPVCAIEACGGETRGQSSDAGAGARPVGVAAAFGGNGGLPGVGAAGFGAGGFTVAAAGFGGFGVGAGLGGTGGLPFVAAAGFGGAGGVAAGGFGGFTVAAGGFGGYGGFQVAGGAFGVAIGGFGGAIRDSGSDANTGDAAKGGHASLDPDEGAFGELGSGADLPKGRTRMSKRRRG